jgi:molecular chaperone GrpE
VSHGGGMRDDRDVRPDEPDTETGTALDGEGEIEILGIEAVDEESEADRHNEAPAAEAPPRPRAAAPVPETGAAADPEEMVQLKDRHLRLLADFDNYRKRAEREQKSQARFSMVEPLRELLPVVDNLERALAAPGSADDLRHGVAMIVRQFLEVLRKIGVEPVPAVGHRFDPRFHEAVMRVEGDDVEAPTVVEELQRGYVFHERLLRPSMVKVAVPPDDGGGEGQGRAGRAEDDVPQGGAEGE